MNLKNCRILMLAFFAFAMWNCAKVLRCIIFCENCICKFFLSYKILSLKILMLYGYNLVDVDELEKTVES